MSVAETILAQLGGRRFIVMTGAKNLMSHTADNALSFRIPGTMTKDRINYVKITLTPDDLYTMEFGKIRGTTYRVIETVEGVYCDMLRDIFTDKTGLETSLGTMGR